MTETKKIGPIALYFQRLDRQGGGAERMLCQLANALVQRGFVVHVVSWDGPEARTFYPLNSAVRWHRLGFSSGVLDKLRRTRALAQLLRRHRIVTLIGFVMSGDMTVFASAKLAGCRIFAAERNGPSMYWRLYSPRRRRINFSLLRLADHILVQSPEFRDGYPEGLRKRIEVIPNPVRPVSVYATPSEINAEGRRVLLAVGRLDPVQKRPHLLIEAFARNADRHSDWDLVLVGDGPARSTLEKFIISRGLADRIRIMPTTREIEKLYLSAHLYAMPSAWEGFPNALAEAMSHGLPAVGFAESEGVAELVRQAGGWIAEERGEPVTSLANCLDLALSNPTELTKRGQAARQAMAVFEPEAIYDRWVQVLGADGSTI